MANLNYNSMLEDQANGDIVYGADTFYALLVTVTYTPNKDTHTKRSDVTNEVVGAGYSSGGQATTAVVSLDTGADQLDIDFSDVSWVASTITARAAVIYKSRGGAASADELVSYCDFGSNITTTGGTFTLDFTGPLRYQN